MTVEKAFGEVLRNLRKKKELSQEKLALESNLDRTFISLLERGLRNPSLSTILQISEALDIEPGNLISLVQTSLPKQKGSLGENT